MSGTRARKESIKVNVEYIGGKLFDSTGLSDGEGFAYDLATDKFLPVPLTATGDMFAANNLSDVANATTALSNLGGEPAIGTKGTSFNLNFGITVGTVAEGNHNHDTVYAASGHDHSGIYEPANANIQSHISDTDNPHGVTLLQLAGFPSAYVADKWMKVNATADGIEFVDAPTGGGGGTWGTITGTLADQTDLQSALDAKANTSHTHSGVYEPVFTKNGAFNKNFGTAASTVCQGNDSRLSDNRTPTDNSITLVKLNAELKSIIALTGTAIDWDSGIEFTKTMTANTTFTDTDLVKGKVIVLWLTGDYSPTFPSYWDIEKGSETYDGTVMNKIVLHCKEDGTDEVWYYITQPE